VALSKCRQQDEVLFLFEFIKYGMQLEDFLETILWIMKSWLRWLQACIKFHKVYISLSYSCIIYGLIKEHSIYVDELQDELKHAVDDGLVTLEGVKTQDDEETEVYRTVDHKSLERGDHDWYCFQCHLGGPIVKCEDCPRVFHLDCLPEDRKPDKDLFVCPPCHVWIIIILIRIF
jgi:hypothetical protein